MKKILINDGFEIKSKTLTERVILYKDLTKDLRDKYNLKDLNDNDEIVIDINEKLICIRKFNL